MPKVRKSLRAPQGANSKPRNTDARYYGSWHPSEIDALEIAIQHKDVLEREIENYEDYVMSLSDNATDYDDFIKTTCQLNQIGFFNDGVAEGILDCIDHETVPDWALELLRKAPWELAK
jgi:hypothetical protein